MTLLRKTMGYLGLGPDEDFEDDDDMVDERPVRRGSPPDNYEAANVRPIPSRPTREGRESREGREGRDERDGRPSRERPVKPERFDQTDTETVRPRAAASASSSVRTVQSSATAKPYAVSPRSFDDAQEVGDRFREGQPVIVNLQEVNRDLSRRLIDFTAGLCYGLGGHMSKVAKDVYLLAPANVEAASVDLAPSDRRR
jgi:cell division inhibitor SepF